MQGEQEAEDAYVSLAKKVPGTLRAYQKDDTGPGAEEGLPGEMLKSRAASLSPSIRTVR